jgi:2-dehydropantoate 2-reductase
MYHISILGHGAVGLSIGSLLLNAGDNNASISFFEKYNGGGLNDDYIVKSYAGNTVVSRSLFGSHYIKRYPIDLLVVSLKIYDLEKCIAEISTSLSENAVILLVSNGLQNHKLVSSYLINRIVIDSILYISCEKRGLYVNNYSVEPNLIIDAQLVNDRLLSIIKPFEILCKRAAIRVRYSTNMNWERWRKLLITSAINGACVNFDLPPKDIFSNSSRLAFLRECIDEGITVAKAHGIDFNNLDADEMVKNILSLPLDCFPSMYLDFKNKRVTEVGYLNGKIYELGSVKGIRTPNNEKIFRTLNSNYAF